MFDFSDNTPNTRSWRWSESPERETKTENSECRERYDKSHHHKNGYVRKRHKRHQHRSRKSHRRDPSESHSKKRKKSRSSSERSKRREDEHMQLNN